MDTKATEGAKSLTVEEARKIVVPLYDALNEPSKKDVAALLAIAAHSDYKSYHTNEDWRTRDELTDVFKGMGVIVPDLRWKIMDILTIGNQIVVRGEATGTPKSEFWTVQPTGQGFKTMTIDIFTVRDGKLASAYHVENWMTALEQMRKREPPTNGR